MVNVSELRLGNKLFSNGKICTVSTIMASMYSIPPIQSLQCLEQRYYHDASEFEPISLTADILMQCGFEKGFFKNAPGYMLDHVFVSEDFQFWQFDSVTQFGAPVGNPLKWMHEFQNLYFAVTGIEVVWRHPKQAFKVSE